MPGAQLSVSSFSSSSRRSAAASAPSVLHALPLASRAGHAFRQRAMLAGYACFLRGVEISASREGEVVARIAAPVVVEVRLRAQHEALTIACTCHASSEPREPCEHGWAALLAIDGANELRELRTSAATLRVELADIPASSREKSACVAKPPGPTLKKAKLVKAPAARRPASAKPRTIPSKQRASASRKTPR
jgi:hypothetical protein